jgi:hypothetical protein
MRRIFALAWVILGLCTVPISAEPQPAFNVIREETSDQRRSVVVRLERRLDETMLMKIAAA